MKNKPRESGDPNDALEALRLHIRSATGDSVRRAIELLVGALRSQTLGTDKLPAADRASFASQLGATASERISAALETFDEIVQLRLCSITSPTNPQASVAQFEQLLSWIIRDAHANAFARVVQCAIVLRPKLGAQFDTHPLDSSVLSRAFTMSIADIVSAPTFSLRSEGALVDALASELAAVYQSANAFIAANPNMFSFDESASSLPIGYDRASESAPDKSAPQPAKNAPLQTEISTEAEAPVSTSDSASPPKTESTFNQHSDSGYAEHAVAADKEGRRLGYSVLAGASQGTDLTVLPILKPVTGMESDAQAFAHAVGELPYSRECRRRYFDEVRVRLDGAGTTATQLALVDLVAAMFDYVVDDRRLTEVAKPLIWRLQQPALLLTLLDSAYMSDDDRSIRYLVEHFGAIANGFGDDLTRGTELYRRLETVVRALEVISNVLHLRAGVLARQVQLEYDRASTNMTQLVQRVKRERMAMEATPGRRNRRDYSRRPGRDQERVVTDQLAASVAAKTAGHELPQSVHQFLDGVWLRYLRTTLLRDGQNSREYQSAVAAVDELVWSLQTGEKTQRRKELAQRIPLLIDRLTRGMHEIGEREEEHQAFFDELFLIHLHKLQRHREPSGLGGQRRETNESPSVQTRADATEYDVSRDVPVLDETFDSVEGPSADALADDSLEMNANASTTGSQFRDSVIDGEITETLMASEPLSASFSEPADEPTDRASTPLKTLTPMIELPAYSDEAHSTLMPTSDFQTDTKQAVTTQIALQTRAVATIDAPVASNDESLGDSPMMDQVAAVDLSDLPASPRYQHGSTDALVQALRPGSWVQMNGGNNRVAWLKIAWANRANTSLLFVRHPDRRVLARDADQLRVLIDQGRLKVLIQTEAASRA